MIDERGLKFATVDCMHTVMHQVLDVAVEDGYIRNNIGDKALKELKQSRNLENEKKKALTVEFLELKKEHIENLLNLCKYLKSRGVRKLDFTAFDSSKLEEYSKKAKEQWGATPEYKEFSEKSKNWTKEYERGLMADFSKIFEEFGPMTSMNPASAKVQAQVKKIQDFITENMYTCTNEILSGLGKMYAGGGEFTENIDKMGGKGTAQFISKAIEIYCG